MGDEQLERVLVGHASAIAAATYRFIAAIAEYDRRGGWQRWECRSMAHWLSWKCAMSPSTANDHVRIGHALEELPLLTAAFAAGEVSYSQIRAITRVATKETEADLLDLAGSMTGAQLERLVSTYRRCRPPSTDDANARHQSRSLTYHRDNDGSLIGTFRLPPEEAAVLTEAIDRRVEHQAVADARADGAESPHGAVRADALVQIASIALKTQDEDNPKSRNDYLVSVVTDAEVMRSEDGQDGVCEVPDVGGLAAETARRLACGDNPTVTITKDHHDNVLDVGRKTRRIHPAMRRALERRDGHCKFPGCSRRSTQAHHVHHWAQGGPTNLDNLVLLCPTHHRRCHEGGYRIKASSAGRHQFVHPNATIIDPGPDLTNAGGAFDDDRSPHLPRPPGTCEPKWDGTKLGAWATSVIVEHLLKKEEQVPGKNPIGSAA